mmetsp:Transcript_16914/g.26034  ORF Transcript_16914/g.26034 Transcript_16914/m.26034 type:complete len:92 (-) Transcript_16914:29-304(-)
MKKEESEDVVSNYLKNLGMVVCLTSVKDDNSGISQVFKLVLPKDLDGKVTSSTITHDIKIQIKEVGQQQFSLFFCDSYGFSHSVKVAVKAE